MKYDFGHLALFTFANRALEWFFHFLLTLFAASLTCSSVTVTGTGFLRYFLLVNRLLYSFLSTTVGLSSFCSRSLTCCCNSLIYSSIHVRRFGKNSSFIIYSRPLER